MKSRFDESPEAGYAFYGGMLNAGYITGFARRAEGRNFVVQQTNEPTVALPVEVDAKNVTVPQDTMPVKVVGRFLGRRLESGHRIVAFRAIMLDRPSIRELPNRLAWEKPVFTEKSKDNFQPFFNPEDTENVSSPFYKGDKKHGRPCLNVARLAGFVESFAFKEASGGERDDCVFIALRQTENPDESIPIRVYGRFADAFRQKLQIGLPIFLEGFYRVKRENHGTSEAPNIVYLPYIHCSTVKVATQTDIKVQPAWWNDMLDRLLRTTRERMAAAGKNIKNQSSEVTSSSGTTETSAKTNAEKPTSSIIEATQKEEAVVKQEPYVIPVIQGL